MRKIIFLVLMILIVSPVYAEKINRVYNNEPGIERDFLIQYDTEQKKYELGAAVYESEKDKNKEYIYIDNVAYDLGTYSVGMSISGVSKYEIYLNDGSVKGITKEEALELYYCKYYQAGGNYSSGTTYIYIFYDNLHKEEYKDSLPEEISCFDLKSNEAKKGEVDSKKSCKTYEDHEVLIEEDFQNFQKTKKYNYIIEANKEIKKLTNLCRSILTYTNYGDNCLNACLDFQDWLESKKNEYGIEENGKIQVCGFSERLIHWIANIIRWVKYIAPVAVIVLGILDFMKAISADKDDEMKKAQQRFIRRLIAAALIFIVPFIIEFILIKLGFNANGCGIINL